MSPDPLRSAPVAQEPLDVEAMKARCDAATHGPWHRELIKVIADKSHIICDLSSTMGKYEPEHANAEFIAHARMDVPNLIREVERLRALASASASPHLAWRPIQTAPKDRRIVVWLESDRKGLVCWQEKAQRWLEYGMGFCDPLYWFDVPAPDLDDAGETHDTVLS